MEVQKRIDLKLLDSFKRFSNKFQTDYWVFTRKVYLAHMQWPEQAQTGTRCS